MDQQEPCSGPQRARHRSARPPPAPGPQDHDAALEDGLEDAEEGVAVRDQRDRGDEELREVFAVRGQEGEGRLHVGLQRGQGTQR